MIALMRARHIPSLPWLPILTLTTGLVLLSACGGDTAPSGKGSAAPDATYPNAPVVLISIDTLRSDRLPAYGYDGVETPALDALRADSILYKRAYAQYPLTLPSHASIFTGMLPPEHGVRDNVGFRLETEGLPFLPRQLQEKGYHTGGAVSAYVLRADTGIGDGYDFYEDSFNLRGGASLGANQRPGSDTVARAIEWLDTVANDEKPFFLFVHLYDPHMPHTPPEPFASRFADPYDGEIATADAAVGELLDAMKRLGVYDSSLIVLLSDHGEGLGDHGEIEHGILLYREVLQVPLMLKLPGSTAGQTLAGTTIERPVSLTEVQPTIASLVGLGGSAPMLNEAGDGFPIYAETYYPRFHLGWSDLASVIEGDLHYIEGPDPELYDLANDPGQTKNILRERRSDFAALRDQLADLRREPETPAAADPETAERLAALGYLAGGASLGSGPLPDPKASLHLLPKLTRAARFQSEQKYAEAAVILKEILEENENLVDAWENLGQCLHALHRYDEAVTAYGKALELSSGSDHIALGAARLFLEMGRLDDAEAHAKLALPTNPANAHRDLARIALARGDLDGAEAAAKASLEARSNAVAPHLILAQASLTRQDIPAAGKHLLNAEAVQARRQADEDVPGLFFIRGEILAYEGRTAEAGQAFLEEIRRFPADTRPYCRLAILYALEQRPREAVGILQKMVQDNPSPLAYAAAIDTLRILGDATAAERLRQHALGLFPEHPKLVELGP